MKLLISIAIACLLSASALADHHEKDKEKMQMEHHKKVSECIAVELYTHSPKHVNRGKEIEKTTQIPEGWTLMGSGGGDGHPTMMVCR